ncbi:MAG: hypothetical protein EPN82_06875 [Bacteroidetes bacterium]|nr:MAG: hypothetical protein EPN82_06875 [Bacteroidota bacterium]
MKKACIVLLFGIIIFNYIPVNAKGANFPYSIGPFITLKGGVNAADVPDGMKNGFTINGLPDFGASGFIPFGDKSQFGLAADLAYSTYSYDLKDNNSIIIKTSSVNYLTLGTNLYIYGFTTGLNFGLPIGGTIKFPFTTNEKSTDEMNLFLEFRIGGMIPLYYDEIGRVNLIIQLGYFLTEQLKDDYSGSYNNHPASGAIGVSYLFNLTD